jgi:hypothetical protein
MLGLWWRVGQRRNREGTRARVNFRFSFMTNLGA